MQLLPQLICFGLATSLSANLLINADFSAGANGLDTWAGYATFTSISNVTINSSWGLADLPVIAHGDGSASFAFNSQLPLADAFWVGSTQTTSFYQDFWLPGNTAGVPNTTDLFGETVRFTGKLTVTEDYAAGNSGVIFLGLLDGGYGSFNSVEVDVLDLPASGEFDLMLTIPEGVTLNLFQAGFRHRGTTMTAGEMTFSDLNLVIVPEPAAASAVLGGAVAFAMLLRRRQGR